MHDVFKISKAFASELKRAHSFLGRLGKNCPLFFLVRRRTYTYIYVYNCLSYHFGSTKRCMHTYIRHDAVFADCLFFCLVWVARGVVSVGRPITAFFVQMLRLVRGFVLLDRLDGKCWVYVCVLSGGFW